LGIYDYICFKKLDRELVIDKFYPINDDKRDGKYYESSYSLMKILNDMRVEEDRGESNSISACLLQTRDIKKSG